MPPATHPAPPHDEHAGQRRQAHHRTVVGRRRGHLPHHRSPLSPVPGTVSNVSLQAFSPAVREWFEASFDEPTRAQRLGWKAIASGDHTLILAPTGSGKTLAAFLWAIDRLSARGAGGSARSAPASSTSRRCARWPSTSRRTCARRSPGSSTRPSAWARALPHVPVVGVRTGDTPARERRTLIAHPPDILITTPESLYLMLTSSARETLRSVRWVIVDEIHALAATKRGAHLALSLERLEELDRHAAAADRPVGHAAAARGDRAVPGRARRRRRAAAGHHRRRGPPQAHGARGRGAGRGHGAAAPRRPAARTARERRHAPAARIWPSIHPRLLELIRAHRSTIVFVNARRLAERLAARLNELAGEDLVRAHHGALAREQRTEVEDALKSGTLRAIVATSSLELGIDMGAVDLVIQVESPGSVASGLQRIGRAGHQVGEPSRGKIFPKFRGDLLEAAVVAERMLAGKIEETRYPRNPLDVLAQQIVAMCAVDEWAVDELYAAVRRAANFADLSREVFLAVLDLLAGRYPSDGFAELRPRLVWDRDRRRRARARRRRAHRHHLAAAPSPTAASSACSCPTARAWASWTKRWSSNPGAARSSCWARPAGASTTSRATG